MSKDQASASEMASERTAHAGLDGVRIWLIGSIPEGTAPADRDRLLGFVGIFTLAAIRAGATVVHGWHPSLFKTLIDAAKVARHSTPTPRGRLKLVRSLNFGPDPGVDRAIDVQVTQRQPTEAEGVKLLRGVLASQVDIAVAFGGRWWSDEPVDRSKGGAKEAGVPVELDLALGQQMPTFVVAGFGGAAQGLSKRWPALMGLLRNGWTDEENRSAADASDPVALAPRILDQMCRLCGARQASLAAAPHSVLSLDGGGIRGAFTAALLANWERRLGGGHIASKFDLITGTSTGGLLAIGLGLGLTAKDMVDFYRTHGPAIFPMISSGERLMAFVRQLADSKFDEKVLEEKLAIAYHGAGRTLRESRTRLAITSYNMRVNAPVVFRTGHTATKPTHDGLTAVSIGRATSAAPTYFTPAHVESDLAPYVAVDGGVWANCPAMVGICEATESFGATTASLRVLSLGTTCTPTRLEPPRWGGFAGWRMSPISLLMLAPMQAAIDQARALLGDRFLRVDGSLATDGLDDVNSIGDLVAFGEAIADAAWPRVEPFFTGPDVAPWR